MHFGSANGTDADMLYVLLPMQVLWHGVDRGEMKQKDEVCQLSLLAHSTNPAAAVHHWQLCQWAPYPRHLWGAWYHVAAGQKLHRALRQWLVCLRRLSGGFVQCGQNNGTDADMLYVRLAMQAACRGIQRGAVSGIK
jgi:hypothetical protein